MAAPRESATKTAAREKARAAAAARLEREKIAELQAQVKELDGLRPEAAENVRAMKDAGLANKEIAELLELSAREVGQYLKAGCSASKTFNSDSETLNDSVS